ncbi:DNA polymerase epsilon noncatalytic subunit [Starmerella bacillaris]|uniref:DNA polymerase epsilon subunit D n=1 Tax=Starmerella bacillaris TaxID=1247836 RepID=A0AAV5RLH2_STABA|nr:DNA polymerase epsilon noncatalytic subunit [Starmerella bacillaris]
MPPKGWKKTSAGFQPVNSANVSIKDHKEHGIDELLLPRSLVARIAKQALPAHTPIPKDGVTALMRSSAMFISYITAQASKIAVFEGRKTINQSDVLQALEKCNFGQFVNPTIELSLKRQKKGEEEIHEDEEPEPEDAEKPANKKAKTD